MSTPVKIEDGTGTKVKTKVTSKNELLVSVNSSNLPIGAATEDTLITIKDTISAGIISDISDRSNRLLGHVNIDNSVLIAGSDGYTRTIKTLSDGTLQNRYKELPTFTVVGTNITIGNNKSMFSIVNSVNSIVNVRLSSIYITNVQTSNVSGVIGTFEIRRITDHSAGTVINTFETMDSSDILNNSITMRTNAVVNGESSNLLWRALFSTDEWAVNATLDGASAGHLFSTMFPIWARKDYDNKPIILKMGEGVTIKFVTNSTAGSFDIMMVFSQE